MPCTALEAGFGAAIITPPTPVQLAGFIEDQPATEVHDDLEVRALFLRGEHGAVCLLVCDLLGMSRGFAKPVRDAVAAALGLDRGAVLTSCIHTHAGPSTIAGSDLLGWVTPDGYREMLVERCVAAARARSRGGGAGDPARRVGGRCPRAVDQPARAAVRPDVRVLDVLGPDGARLGTLANVSIHPVALGPECLAVSSDWVGPFRARARTTGGRHRGAAVGRDRRRQPAPRPPPEQRLRRRRLRRGGAARTRRRRGRRRRARRRRGGRRRRPGSRAASAPST